MKNLTLLNAAIEGHVKPKARYTHDFTVLLQIDGYAKPAKIELSCLVEVYKEKTQAIVSLTRFDGIENCIAQLINELFKLPWRRGISYENVLWIVRKTEQHPLGILELVFKNAEVERVEWFSFDKIIDIKKDAK